jgi:L-asparaginase / beta-aspartyl-peptidase
MQKHSSRSSDTLRFQPFSIVINFHHTMHKAMHKAMHSTIVVIMLLVSLLFSLIQPLSMSAQVPMSAQASAAKPPIALAIHGGAGTILKSTMTPEKEVAFRTTLKQALLAGYDVLKNHGTSLDAVCVAIRVMEDSPLFNAGKGAVFTAEGKNEMDAAIMDGSTLKAGAITGVRHIKNPIDLARAVMEKSPHVMLTGSGAEIFAKTLGFKMTPESYFFTPNRWESLQKAKEAEKRGIKSDEQPAERKHGTVGCVALDESGNLAAGTSTGGMTNKKWGRVGDAPIIGAGTYANNATCAVSATGHGEYFIRAVVAADISAQMLYKGSSLQAAADDVVMRKLVTMNGGKGEGGVIAIDRTGALAMPFNSAGMYRASIDTNGTMMIGIYENAEKVER